jgi:hypothetical protein
LAFTQPHNILEEGILRYSHLYSILSQSRLLTSTLNLQFQAKHLPLPDEKACCLLFIYLLCIRTVVQHDLQTVKRYKFRQLSAAFRLGL